MTCTHSPAWELARAGWSSRMEGSSPPPTPSAESEINSSLRLFYISPVGRFRVGEWVGCVQKGAQESQGRETTAQGPALSALSKATCFP